MRAFLLPLFLVLASPAFSLAGFSNEIYVGACATVDVKDLRIQLIRGSAGESFSNHTNQAELGAFIGYRFSTPVAFIGFDLGAQPKGNSFIFTDSGVRHLLSWKNTYWFDFTPGLNFFHSRLLLYGLAGIERSSFDLENGGGMFSTSFWQKFGKRYGVGIAYSIAPFIELRFSFTKVQYGKGKAVRLGDVLRFAPKSSKTTLGLSFIL